MKCCPVYLRLQWIKYEFSEWKFSTWIIIGDEFLCSWYSECVWYSGVFFLHFPKMLKSVDREKICWMKRDVGFRKSSVKFIFGLIEVFCTENVLHFYDVMGNALIKSSIKLESFAWWNLCFKWIINVWENYEPDSNQKLTLKLLKMPTDCRLQWIFICTILIWTILTSEPTFRLVKLHFFFTSLLEFQHII